MVSLHLLLKRLSKINDKPYHKEQIKEGKKINLPKVHVNVDVSSVVPIYSIWNLLL